MKLGTDQTIQTPRTVIRPFKDDDCDALLAVGGDPEVMRMVDDGKPRSRDQVVEWLRKCDEEYRKGDWATYAVVEKQSSRLIGYAGFVNSCFNRDHIEIVYGFTKDVSGKGYGKEIALALSQWAFSSGRLDRLFATIDPTNVASLRILQGLRMAHVLDRSDEHGLPESLYELEKMISRYKLGVIDESVVWKTYAFSRIDYDNRDSRTP